MELGPYYLALGVKKERVDVLLVERGLCESREVAKRLVLAGEVSSGGHVVAKPGHKVGHDTPLEVKERPKFVGRGGLKLERALDEFGIDPAGLVCADIATCAACRGLMRRPVLCSCLASVASQNVDG